MAPIAPRDIEPKRVIGLSYNSNGKAVKHWQSSGNTEREKHPLAFFPHQQRSLQYIQLTGDGVRHT
jgi:hypothetical protein